MTKANPRRTSIGSKSIAIHLSAEMVKDLRQLQGQLLESGNPLLVAAGGNIFELARSAVVVGVSEMRKGIK